MENSNDIVIITSCDFFFFCKCCVDYQLLPGVVVSDVVGEVVIPKKYLN